MTDNKPTSGGDADFAGPYREIPRRLKDYYDSIQEETIPDRFLDLLEKLAEAEEAAAATPMTAAATSAQEVK